MYIHGYIQWLYPAYRWRGPRVNDFTHSISLLKSSECTPLIFEGKETVFVGTVCSEGPACHTAMFKTKFSLHFHLKYARFWQEIRMFSNSSQALNDLLAPAYGSARSSSVN